MKHEFDRMQRWATKALAMITEDMGEACACAYEAGRYRLEMPSILLQHASLVEAYEKGGADAAMEHKRDDGVEGRVSCWSGEWEMDMDGVCEARPMVAMDANGYYAGLQVSRMGGNSVPSWSEPPFSSIDQAMKAANVLLAEWSQGEEEKEGRFQSAFLQLALWKWDGKNVSAIVAKAPMHELFPDKKSEWAISVPEEYRGVIRGADQIKGDDYDSCHIEILAIDIHGQALVLDGGENFQSHGEWSQVRFMPKDEAFALANQYRCAYAAQQQARATTPKAKIVG